MRKQPERTAKTKQKLIDAFWKLYCEKPIEKITIKDITDEAGYYRSTFYEYFPDVYSILDEIENALIEKYKDIADTMFQAEDLLSAQKVLLSFYAENGEYIAVLLGPDGDQKFSNTAISIVRDTLVKKTRLNLEDPKIELLMEMLPAAIIAMLNYWYRNRETLPIQTVLSTCAEIMQHGILPTLSDVGIPFLSTEKFDQLEH